MNKKLIKPNPQEDALLTEAAFNDSDSVPLTDSEWNQVKHNLKRGPGRPKGTANKAQITIRLDFEVIQALKATGAGWQTRANDILRKSIIR
jgi:uncharacterized protein (DUF4415 family)